MPNSLPQVCHFLILLGALSLASTEALGQPVMVNPADGTLTLVTPSAAEQAKLGRVDGLDFDPFGNLMAVLEISDATAGAVYIDKLTGAVTTLITGVSRLDQIALDPSGDLWVTREVGGPSTSNRIYRLVVGYDGSNTPIPTGTSLTTLVTSENVDHPEGLVVLESASAFGNAGDLYVAEDGVSGGVYRIEPATGTATLLSGDLNRPEGMALGTFSGQAPSALYVAVTLDHVIKRIEADGTTTTFGDPAAVSLTSPDNVEFGPDGYMYVTEDRIAPNSRIIRVAPDGTHSVYATGFDEAQGMIFDDNGDMYVAEQGLARIWRIRPPSAVPGLPAFAGNGRFLLALLALIPGVFALRRRSAT
ncbi:MAG: hypothetical protein CL908_22565 [Deltaproteobacteria bacterium]|nr:hypothetical protein [Deltaproteobacteria bacterium]